MTQVFYMSPFEKVGQRDFSDLTEVLFFSYV